MTPIAVTLVLYVGLLWLEVKSLIPAFKFLVGRKKKTQMRSIENLKETFSEVIWTSFFASFALLTLVVIWFFSGRLAFYTSLSAYGIFVLLELMFYLKFKAQIGGSRTETRLKGYAIFSKSLHVLFCGLLIVLNLLD